MQSINENIISETEYTCNAGEKIMEKNIAEKRDKKPAETKDKINRKRRAFVRA